MGTSKRKLHEALRARYMAQVSEFFGAQGEEILRTASNEFALPCVDDEGNDEFIVLTFKVPTGSRDGDAYDGYSMAQAYTLKCEQAKAKAEKAKADKARKIERDRKLREAKAKAKAEREGKA